MPDILQQIAASQRQLLVERQAARPLAELMQQVTAMPPAAGFRASIARPGLTVIAELKRASPSAGVLRAEFPVARLAADLAGAGAGALSILTEEKHFMGDPAYLAQARTAAPSVPLLRKDFLLDPWQIWESRVLGADAVLLIVALLPGEALREMMAAAREAGLDCLVEAHDEAELALALAADAKLVGINARDLRTFQVDLDRVERLAACLPAAVTAVAESGVRGAEDLQRLAAAGYQGVLLGSALMRHPRPGEALRRWLDQLPGRPVA